MFLINNKFGKVYVTETLEALLIFIFFKWLFFKKIYIFLFLYY
jgi:hypothetical protein